MVGTPQGGHSASAGVWWYARFGVAIVEVGEFGGMHASGWLLWKWGSLVVCTLRGDHSASAGVWWYARFGVTIVQVVEFGGMHASGWP